jgi:hypothetical protein
MCARAHVCVCVCAQINTYHQLSYADLYGVHSGLHSSMDYGHLLMRMSAWCGWDAVSFVGTGCHASSLSLGVDPLESEVSECFSNGLYLPEPILTLKKIVMTLVILEYSLPLYLSSIKFPYFSYCSHTFRLCVLHFWHYFLCVKSTFVYSNAFWVIYFIGLILKWSGT